MMLPHQQVEAAEALLAAAERALINGLRAPTGHLRDQHPPTLTLVRAYERAWQILQDAISAAAARG